MGNLTMGEWEKKKMYFYMFMSVFYGGFYSYLMLMVVAINALEAASWAMTILLESGR